MGLQWFTFFFINFFYPDREDEIRDVMDRTYLVDEVYRKFKNLRYKIPPIETTAV